MNNQGKDDLSDQQKKISLKRIKKSIHVPEAQLRAALKSRSLRDEQIEFLCELLSIDASRKRDVNTDEECNDLFMQGKIFC